MRSGRRECPAGGASLGQREPFDWNLIFQLPDGTTRLWWKVSKTTLSVAEPDAPACLSALPESIMALVDHSQYEQ